MSLYDHLRDQLWETPGEWRLVRCSNRACGLIFLDPLPSELETTKAYERYYTHGDEEDEGEPTRSPGLGWVRSFLHRANRTLMGATGTLVERRRAGLAYLEGERPGRVLEVGCGSGKRLAELRQLGWEVLGQEVDERAASVARDRYNLTILVGALADLALPDASFDAVVMNHVIEHVRHPVELLRQSWRLLKPGGCFVCITPNVNGVGHRVFGRNWFGLDPPRHLHVFSERTLDLAARKARIENSRRWTSTAKTINFAYGSLKQQRPREERPRGPLLRMRLVAALVHYVAVVARLVVRSSGDECVLWAVK